MFFLAITDLNEKCPFAIRKSKNFRQKGGNKTASVVSDTFTLVVCPFFKLTTGKLLLRRSTKSIHFLVIFSGKKPP